MDAAFYAIISSVSFGLLAFLIMFLLFIFLRKYRSRHNPMKNARNAVYSESDTPLIELLSHVWRSNLGNIYDQCGLETYIYLSLYVKIIYCLLILLIFGLFILLPIYSLGTEGDIIA